MDVPVSVFGGQSSIQLENQDSECYCGFRCMSDLVLIPIYPFGKYEGKLYTRSQRGNAALYEKSNQ